MEQGSSQGGILGTGTGTLIMFPLSQSSIINVGIKDYYEVRMLQTFNLHPCATKPS